MEYDGDIPCKEAKEDNRMELDDSQEPQEKKVACLGDNRRAQVLLYEVFDPFFRD